MTLRLDCPGCAAPLDVGARHRGRQVACPSCRGAVTVPRLHFRDARIQAVDDRRAADRAFIAVLVVTLLWFATPVCALLWWTTSRRAHLAAQDGRVAPEPLLAARVVAAVATCAQLSFWGLLAAWWL